MKNFRLFLFAVLAAFSFSDASVLAASRDVGAARVDITPVVSETYEDLDGDYQFNAPHGLGVYTRADGTIYAGEWKQGCFTDGRRTANLGVPAEDCGL